MESSSACPCDSGTAFSECCGPFLSGTAFPDTAEKLMRSRYTAYAKGKTSYVMQTVHPENPSKHDPESIREWAESVEWKRLEIVTTQEGGPEDEEGYVRYRAWYKDKKGLKCLREVSCFLRHESHWAYRSGVFPEGKIAIGRNDPCPCGSGLKYKKCCR